MVTGDLFSQTAEPEKALRTYKNDTTNGWQYGGTLMLNAGQTSLTNWVAGGENSMSGNTFFNGFSNYRKKSFTWDNTIDLAYGLLKQKGQNQRKTDDKLDFSTKIGLAASKNWYYAGLLNFRSQFSPGYNYPNDSVKISEFLAPAYIVTAIGMDFKPGKAFTSFIAPLTGKITIVANDSLADKGAFGVEPAKYNSNKDKIAPGHNMRKEFGGYCKIAFQKDVMTNVNLMTKIDLFSNYEDKPQNVDVNWQVLVSMKINKFLSASLSTQLIYDDDVNYIDKQTKEDLGPKVQFKEVLGVGFSYRFAKNNGKKA
jgi:hypothetical protein